MYTSITAPFLKRTFHIKVTHVLLGLVLAGALIRFYRLDYASLWLDEIYSMIGSNPDKSWAEIYQYSKQDQPPFFFILLNAWLKIFGYTDLAGRSIACIYGLLGIIAIYFLGKEIKNERLGLLVAFITTINWFHTDISKEIRFYPLVFLLSTLSYLFFFRCIKRGALLDFILYALATSLLLNTHYYGMVLFVSQALIFLIILIFYNRSARLLIGGIFTGVLTGFSLYHWLPVIQSDLNITSFHVNPLQWDFPFGFAWNYVKEPVAFGVYAVCIFLVLRVVYQKVRQKQFNVQYFIMFGWVFIGILIPLIYSITKMPLLTYKYSTIIVPALFIFIAYGLMLIKEKVRAYLILTITLSGFIVLFIARPPHKPRRAEDWREVAYYFSKYRSNDHVIFNQLAWFDQYYFRKYDLKLPVNQYECDFKALVQETDSIWLFTNIRYTGHHPIGFQSEQKEIIRQEFDIQNVVKFTLTKAFLYVRKRPRKVNEKYQ
jgi:uncharacterized membrane protein